MSVWGALVVAVVALALAPVPWARAHHDATLLGQQPAVTAPVVDSTNGRVVVAYGGERLTVTGLGASTPAPGDMLDVVPDPGIDRAVAAPGTAAPSAARPVSALLGGLAMAALLGAYAGRNRRVLRVAHPGRRAPRQRVDAAES